MDGKIILEVVTENKSDIQDLSEEFNLYFEPIENGVQIAEKFEISGSARNIVHFLTSKYYCMDPDEILSEFPELFGEH